MWFCKVLNVLIWTCMVRCFEVKAHWVHSMKKGVWKIIEDKVTGQPNTNDETYKAAMRALIPIHLTAVKRLVLFRIIAIYCLLLSLSSLHKCFVIQ